MATSSAEPAKLLAFEEATDEALGALYGPALTLAEKLEAVRSNAQSGRFLPDIPYIHHEVLDLFSVGRYLAGWVGDIGRAFQRYDEDGDGVVDDSLLQADVRRIGNGTFTVIRVGGRVYIDTGDGSDEVTVTQGLDGRLVVMVNGVSVSLTEAEASNLTIRVGSGNDTIEVGTDVGVHFRLEGQSGTTTWRVAPATRPSAGGAGRDYIDGFSGGDVLDGGDGNDVVYAGDGNDLVSGGTGVDYLEGGVATTPCWAASTTT